MSTKLKPGEVTSNRATIRAEMAAQGVTIAVLAQRLGSAENSVYTAVSAGGPSLRFRRHAEAALNYAPCFADSNTDELSLRAFCVAQHGFDPCLLARSELFKCTKALGITIKEEERSIPDALAAIFAKLAATRPLPKTL